MIYTSNYIDMNKHKNKNLISISGDGGATLGFSGNSYKKLAPKYLFWKEWHDNVERKSEIENNKFYVEEFYKKVLKDLDPIEVLKELGKNPILICYEDSEQFCHRHIVAFWFEMMLGIGTKEIHNNKAVNRPNYIKELLTDCMQKEDLKSSIIK